MGQEAQKFNVCTAKQPGAAELFPQSATLAHLKGYRRLLEWASVVLSSSVVSYAVVLLIALLGLTKQYLVDAPTAPTVSKEGYHYFLIFLRKLDRLVDRLVLRDGVDAFFEQMAVHNHTLGVWTVYFLLDFLANASNYVLRTALSMPETQESIHENGNSVDSHSISGGNVASSLTSATQSMQTARTTDSNEGSVKLSLIGNELPHVRELTDTTIALRKDISEKYIAPTKSILESYLEPTKNRIEAQYFQPINEKLGLSPPAAENHQNGNSVSKNQEEILPVSNGLAKSVATTTLADVGSTVAQNIKPSTNNDGIQSLGDMTTIAERPIQGGNENEEIAAA
ncbi:HBR210Cp [Eremothecium sinecaudum]|uniref:HBR210Cp n=1 Tax=Eremothecium sinecaudum TaxID=45286 RepID=A0A120K192_9SACH|nr:HBR210Cp [Eremothecium sinecaudum]AMD19111.1 HBR210Cp [Eremothecium sinecaudum]